MERASPRRRERRRSLLLSMCRGMGAALVARLLTHKKPRLCQGPLAKRRQSFQTTGKWVRAAVIRPTERWVPK